MYGIRDVVAALLGAAPFMKSPIHEAIPTVRTVRGRRAPVAIGGSSDDDRGRWTSCGRLCQALKMGLDPNVSSIR